MATLLRRSPAGHSWNRRAPLLRSLLVLIGFCTFATAGSPVARADNAKEASSSFMRGTALFQQKDFGAALTAFQRAYALRPHYSVLCSIARCYEYLSSPLEASVSYRRCLEDGGQRSPRALRIQRALEAVERRVAYGNVTSDLPDASVHVDGRRVGRAPCRIPLNPGEHLVELRRRGRRLVAAKLVIGEGEERMVHLAAKLSRSTLPRPAPATQAVSTPSRRHLRSGWFWSTVAATLAFAGTTVALGAVTLRKRSDYEAEQTQENADSFYRYRMLTNVLVGLTAAAAGTSFGLYFFTDFGAKERRDGIAGIGLQGRF